MKKVLSIISMLAIAFTLSFGVGSGTAAAQSCSVSTSEIFYNDGIDIEISESGCNQVTATLEFSINGVAQPSETRTVNDFDIFYLPLQFDDEYSYTLTVTSDNGTQTSGSSGIF